MTNIYNVSKGELIALTAEKLKSVGEISPPDWALFVKTGTNKERPPFNNDWWYHRSASVMLKLFDFGPVGVSKLRTKYGSKKRRGHKPAEFRKAGGKIIRLILQQLEKAGFAKQEQKGVHKGRILTPKGVSLLNSVATELRKSSSAFASPSQPKGEQPGHKAEIQGNKKKQEQKQAEKKEAKAEPEEAESTAKEAGKAADKKESNNENSKEEKKE